MGTSYREFPHSVNGKSVARAYCAALWRLYVQPPPPMWLLCRAFGVSSPTILKAVRKLSNGAGKPKGREARLAEHLLRSSPGERRKAARVLGPDVIWDEMVEPLIHLPHN